MHLIDKSPGSNPGKNTDPDLFTPIKCFFFKIYLRMDPEIILLHQSADKFISDACSEISEVPFTYLVAYPYIS